MKCFLMHNIILGSKICSVEVLSDVQCISSVKVCNLEVLSRVHYNSRVKSFDSLKCFLMYHVMLGSKVCTLFSAF